MEGMGPDWKGLFKWSVAQSDGTGPSSHVSEEDRRWFTEAIQAQTFDAIKRMKEITLVMSMPPQVLEAQGVTVPELEEMLEELQEHVESIDMANDIHALGGLVPLLGYLKSPHAGVRARAAEVVSTIVQNNPKSQQQVMEARGLEYLLSDFTSDDDMTVRTKALGAISSLIRHNKAGIAAFRLSNGYAGLRDALASEHPRFQRKALQLLQYLLQENPKDAYVPTQLGFLRSLTSLASHADADIREGALHALVEIVRNQGKGEASVKANDNSQLKNVLSSRIEEIKGLNQEDLAALREERHLIDFLWQLSFNETSSLRESGLLVLPGDDEIPPDVASRRFEPVLQAAPEPPSGPSSRTEANGKHETSTLLLGL